MATFGNTATNIDAYLNTILDRTYLGKFTLTEDGAITNIVAFVQWETSLQSIKGVIYSDNAGEPNTLLGVTPAVDAEATDAHIQTTFGSPVALTAGDYWLGVVSSGTSIYVSRSAATGGDTRTIVESGSYASPPTTWNTASDSASTQLINVYGIYFGKYPSAWLTA